MQNLAATDSKIVNFSWEPIDPENYSYRFEAVWPACGMKRRSMFLLGEPMDHRGDDTNAHAPRYLAHMRDADGCWVGTRPVTVAEFMRVERR